MATQAQIAANRRNAKKSTGPRTAEGKRIVSQNAIKHGLFAQEAVIKCEDPADFELHRDAMLGELRPVGMMESTLAERMVRLSWRMLRAERMQNQAADRMIEAETLPLGRVATKLWSDNVKTLELLLMHDRRLESSFYKTMTKLKTLQTVRRIEWEAAEERSTAEVPAAEYRNSDFVKQTQSRAFGRTCPDVFAEQSQFVPGLVGVTSFAGADYDAKQPTGRRPNKANRTGSERSRTGQFHVQRRSSRAEKGEVVTFPD